MLQKEQTAQEIFSVLQEDSTLQGIKDTLKLCMDSLKSTTLQNLLAQDQDYQDARLAYQEAVSHYQSADFAPSQREIVDTILARDEERCFEHVTNAYIAGLLDSYRILRDFGLTLE